MITSIALNNQWDLSLDSNGNISTLNNGNALAQDVACAISLFLGELYWDTTIGVPWLDILGESYNQSLLSILLEDITLLVPGVISASVTINSYQSGRVNGIVNFIDSTGQSLGINF